MSIENVLSLLGGLGLFLFGMQLMGNGLEVAAGDSLKSILQKLTSNRFLGVLVGAGVTAIIQSSSATTVMIVGFVNAKMMTLQQAVWIIMGANIGTTITGQLIALDIGALAPLLAFIGIVMMSFMKKKKTQDIGQIIAGLGILFIGMNLMSTAMMPLRESQKFVDIVTHFSNPLIGILVGALFTAIIQSSSASVGILQALATSGIIGLHEAVYVLFGQNIGTCITAVLASIGSSREAKQTTIIHLTFNIVGTILFTIICMATPLVNFVIHFTPENAPQQIANMHTLFNVCTTLVLLPFGVQLADFAKKILPDEPVKVKDARLLYLQPANLNQMHLGTTSILLNQVKDETNHMLELAYQNLEIAFNQLIHFDEKQSTHIYEQEQDVNYLNKAISHYISIALTNPYITISQSQKLSSYYLVLVDVERISDYAIHINHQAKKDLQNQLNQEEIQTITTMRKLTLQNKKLLDQKDQLKQQVDHINHLAHTWRQKQIQDLKNKHCSNEMGMMLNNVYTDFERINEHAYSMAKELNKTTE